MLAKLEKEKESTSRTKNEKVVRSTFYSERFQRLVEYFAISRAVTRYLEKDYF